MNFRAVLFGLIALLAAGGTIFGAKNWLDAQRAAMAPKPVAAAAPKPATQILVAKQNLPQGTLLQPGHLHWQTWPDSGVIDAYAVRNKRKLEDFVGSVVRGGIAAGEPVTDIRVVFPGERGFLAAVLEVGMRAVTVPIDATSGIAGFVFPGDRVDLILTHSPDRGNESGKQQRKASETVLSGVRVLAIDQRTNDQVNKPDLGRTATLEVTAKQAEMIPIITELGRLSLALRSLESPDQLVSGEAGDDPTQDPKRRKPGTRGETFTLDNEVSRLLDPPKKAGGGGQTVSVIQGGKAKTVTFNKSAQGWVPVMETAVAHTEGEKSEPPAPPRGEGGEK